MEVGELIALLSDPAAYPQPAAVEVRQTHISVVVLVGDVVYKVRKPVRLGFLDFSTPDRRRRDCEDEVRLNRRLASWVYLGVVCISRTTAGLRVEGDGPPVEWAVKMRRLPERASLLEHLRRGELTAAHVVRLAGVVAGFHRSAGAGPEVSAGGRLEVVARNARDNFDQSEPEVGVTVSRPVFDRLRQRTADRLAELGPEIESRAARGVPRDTHGDLHLDHVHLLPDRPPPDDLVAIDCVEFNDRFRFADPVADMAFLVMDLKFRGRRDLAGTFADAYFRAAGDPVGRALLPFYTAYRAAVRAKVEGLTLREPEVPAAVREASRGQAEGHWLLALGELESPGRRPALPLVGGLPGTGKSTLARDLSHFGFAVIRSDEVRRELFPEPQPPAAVGEGAYTAERTALVYADCRRRAEADLLAGRRVVVDANFRDEVARTPFAVLAARLAVPLLLVVCEATPEVVRGRLAGRRGNASEADWPVYLWATARWEQPAPGWAGKSLSVTTDEGVTMAVETIREWLRSAGLLV